MTAKRIICDAMELNAILKIITEWLWSYDMFIFVPRASQQKINK